MVFFWYFVLAAAVVFFSVKCADYVDLLDKKSNISGAFIGGIILAAVTSLPELFTSISAVFIVHNSALVVGNVLGSNLFNLAIFGCLVVFTAKRFRAAPLAKSHLATLACSAVSFVLCMGAILLNLGTLEALSLNAVSFLILIIYVISFRSLSEESGDSDDDTDSPLTVKQIAARFALMACGLIIFSIVITFVTDIIAARLSLDASFAGALFLGVVTSLPEMTSSITLVRKGNYNAMTGNIVGSNMFNFIILSIADFMTRDHSIYIPSEQTGYLLWFGIISTFLVGIVLLTKRFSRGKNQKWLPYFYAAVSFLSVACYFGFLVLSA